MAIYAFDGTGSEDNPGTEKDTNVLKFYQAFEETYEGSGKCFYVSGIGTRKGIVGKIFGSLFGAGGQQRVEEGIECLEANFAKGDREIIIVGYSRGAALALEFANEIRDHGISGEEAPEINFLGIFDTVASFGIPGNNVNLGYTLTVPPNVKNCYHALALDERRQGFPLTRAVQDSYSSADAINISEVWFRGFHGDIGGGNENEGLSSIALVWMMKCAIGCDVSLSPSHLQKHMAWRNHLAECSKPGMDIIANKKRTLFHTDVVHESVARREWAARRFPANNPPVGMKVINDDGEFLAAGFDQ